MHIGVPLWGALHACCSSRVQTCNNLFGPSRLLVIGLNGGINNLPSQSFKFTIHTAVSYNHFGKRSSYVFAASFKQTEITVSHDIKNKYGTIKYSLWLLQTYFTFANLLLQNEWKNQGNPITTGAPLKNWLETGRVGETWTQVSTDAFKRLAKKLQQELFGQYSGMTKLFTTILQMMQSFQKIGVVRPHYVFPQCRSYFNIKGFFNEI